MLQGATSRPQASLNESGRVDHARRRAQGSHRRVGQRCRRHDARGSARQSGGRSSSAMNRWHGNSHERTNSPTSTPARRPPKSPRRALPARARHHHRVPRIRDLFSHEVQVGKQIMRTHNAYWCVLPGADGMKTGLSATPDISGGERHPDGRNGWSPWCSASNRELHAACGATDLLRTASSAISGKSLFGHQHRGLAIPTSLVDRWATAS